MRGDIERLRIPLRFTALTVATSRCCVPSKHHLNFKTAAPAPPFHTSRQTVSITLMAQQNNNRNSNSPHLSNNNSHLQNGSAPPSPSMSGSQQPQQGGQRPSGYPSPTNGNYPSPSMSNAQYYPPPNQPQAPEPYRASSTGSNNSMSLPSMRLIDQQSQQQQQQQNMGSGLPPPVAHMGGPYYHNQGQTLPHPSHQYANVTSDPSGQMRYALPVSADSRVMSGGRHKKVSISLILRAGFIFANADAPAGCKGDQTQNQDRLPYMPEA